jgi:hypothetical protein
LALALSSTLLSSQRTTTHRRSCRLLGDRPPGHSFNFTRSLWPCQPVSPGSYHSALVIPRPEARGFTAFRSSKDLAGRPLRISPLARPFPCRLGKHYRLAPRAPNRVPVSRISAGQRRKTAKISRYLPAIFNYSPQFRPQGGKARRQGGPDETASRRGQGDKARARRGRGKARATG